ncbi:MAG: hypothetical protein FJ387_02580 [Verrucomicrobia bacterium]|nr:hypothetical protein [Verrucomicrobiota bacterium]
MRRTVPQPPVDPLLRDAERHDFWLGLGVALVAIILLLSGARHVTGIETEPGQSARETQLVRAFARGGLEFQEAVISLDPALFEDPSQAAAALDRAARIVELPLRDRYRVNLGAKDPCPT